MDITQITANMSLTETGNSNDAHRRTDYISWQEYFMGLALLSAQRSKDARLQVGACIVNDDNKIISLGYNGMPLGRDDIFPWNGETTKYICHAEMNAILNTNADLKGCTIYITMFPCNECTKLIVQSGIKKIIYLSDKKAEKPKYIASKNILNDLNFDIKKYEPRRERIEIDFTGKSTSIQN